MKKGKLTIFSGPMFSGKSYWLLRKYFENQEHKLIFKIKIDTRDEIYSRAGSKVKAIKVTDANELWTIVNKEKIPTNVYIEEVQFFDKKIIKVIKKILMTNNVFVAGLDTDYRQKQFAITAKIIKLANEKHRLYSECQVCHQEAQWTVRTLNHQIDKTKNHRIVIDDKNLNNQLRYEPRCDKHLKISRKFKLIVAYNQDMIIGYKNKLPWNIPADLEHFKATTKGRVILLGATTFTSLPKELINNFSEIIVLDKNHQEEKIGTITYFNNKEAIYKYEQKTNKEIYVCGGETIYRQFLPYVNELIITKINIKCNGDRFFPNWNEKYYKLTKTVMLNEQATIYYYKN